MEVAALRFGGGRALPLFLQTEAAECGLASLGMVASFHGHRVDLAGLRRHFTVSLKGATLAGPRVACSSSGVNEITGAVVKIN